MGYKGIWANQMVAYKDRVSSGIFGSLHMRNEHKNADETTTNFLLFTD